MYEFKILGRIPSKKNSRITNRKTGRSFPSKDYVKWHKEAEKQLSNLANEGLDCPLSFTYSFYLPDNRRCDLSNKVESINDLLVDIGFIKDDNWKIVRFMHIYMIEAGVENPRVEILVNEL